MRHEMRIEGENFRLRPVTIEDAAFIIELRTNPERSRLIHPISPSVSDQECWLEQYFERSGDYYFIIEHNNTARPEGTIGIYDLDTTRMCAEWGRWIVRPGSIAAIESAVLIYKVAFTLLDLEMVYCRTPAENARVVLFHKIFGLTSAVKLPAHFKLNGIAYDAIEQRMTREVWQKSQAAWEAKASWVAKLCE